MKDLAVQGLVVLGAAWTEPALAACKLQQVAELPVTMAGAQPTIPVKVNGRAAQFELDSGAFYSTLSPAAAARLGLDAHFVPNSYMRGVGGDADLKSATIDAFSLAGLQFHHIDIAVAQGAGDGLLGQNILGAADVEYDLGQGLVRIFEAPGCGVGDNLAYWTKSDPTVLNMEDDRSRIVASGAVNGKHIRLQFDTGASYSIMSMQGAAQVGVSPQTPGAQPGGGVSGIGERRSDSWIVPVDSFALGNEQVQHTRLRIGTIELSDADMLLGVDFFLSHRVFVSNSLRRIYFTYSGGPVFRLDRASVAQLAQGAATSPAAQAALANPNGPTDAAGLARRAAAEVSRLDYAQALVDFDRSIALDPTDAKTFYGRAMAHAANGQPALAMADLDQAIKLKPDDAEALRARAAAFLSGGDMAHGRADLEAAAKAATDEPALGLAIAGMFESPGLLQEGVEQLDRWIAANPKADPDQKANALNERCWFRAVLKTGLDQALVDCNAALKLAPNTAAFLDSRGHVRLDRGEYDLAIADYDAALRDNPKRAGSLYGRGVAKLKKGMTPGGEADIQAALAIDPRLAQQAPRMGLDRPADVAKAPPQG